MIGRKAHKIDIVEWEWLTSASAPCSYKFMYKMECDGPKSDGVAIMLT